MHPYLHFHQMFFQNYSADAWKYRISEWAEFLHLQKWACLPRSVGPREARLFFPQANFKVKPLHTWNPRRITLPYSCMSLYMQWPLRNFYTFNHLVDSYRNKSFSSERISNHCGVVIMFICTYQPLLTIMTLSVQWQKYHQFEKN